MPRLGARSALSPLSRVSAASRDIVNPNVRGRVPALRLVPTKRKSRHVGRRKSGLRKDAP